MNPLTAAVALNAAVPNSSKAHRARKLPGFAQGVQTSTADHDLCFSCIYAKSLLLHSVLPGQESNHALLHSVGNHDEIVRVQIFTRYTSAEFTRELPAR